MKKSILIFAFSSLLYINMQAQLKFKNSESNPVDVAIAYYVKTDEFEGWYSSGWYTIDPGETKTLIAGDLAYLSYYYYAKDTKGGEWKGGGKYNFIIDNGAAFKIKNANKDYQLEGNENRKYKAFKKVDVPDRSPYTLTLTEE